MKPSFRKIIVLITAAFFMGSMVQADPSALTTLTWPGIDKVYQFQQMYLSSNPAEEGLKHAKMQGVKTIINLLEPSEMDKNEPKAVKKLGLRYVSIPFSVAHPSETSVEQVLKVLRETGAKNVLIHCDYAGRALTMWAIYMGRTKGYTPEMAIKHAKDAGLNHQGLEQFAFTYLKRHQPQPGARRS